MPAAKKKPTRYRVIWWQHIILGGLGWTELNSFRTREEAKAFAERYTASMTTKDRRRLKIEPEYV